MEQTTRQKIIDVLSRYSIDVQDALSGVASHEARRLIGVGTPRQEDELSTWARHDARKLLGRDITSRQEDAVYQVVDLYLGDREELQRATGKVDAD